MARRLPATAAAAVLVLSVMPLAHATSTGEGSSSRSFHELNLNGLPNGAGFVVTA
jgi:hypothetical protein